MGLRIKWLALRVGLLAFSLALAITCAEIGLRAAWPQPTAPAQFTYDPLLGTIPLPNERARRTLPGVYSYTYSNNSLGLRGSREYAAAKAKPRRILFLGDSFTYGLGVNDDETFPFYLEERLKDTEIINAGQSGKGTDYELRAFEVFGPRYRPDVVALGFFANDFWDNEQQLYYETTPQGLRPKDLAQSEFAKKGWRTWPAYSWLLARSHLANLVRQAFFNRIAVPQSPNGTKEESSNEKNIKLTESYFRELAQAVKAQHIPFIVFYIPKKHDVESYRNAQGVRQPDEEAITKIAAAQGVELVSLTPILAASGFHLDDLYLQEGHFKPLGNRLLAIEMAWVLRAKQ